MPSLGSSTGDYISKQNAEGYTERYRDNHPNPFAHSHFFGKTKLLEVINQQDVMGIRIYNGYSLDSNNDLVPEMIIVAVNSDNEDILDTNKILDFSGICPPNCPKSGSEHL